MASKDISSHQKAFAAWKEHKSAKRIDPEFTTGQLLAEAYPECRVTRTDPDKCDLMGYARAGHAKAVLDESLGGSGMAGYEATRAYRPPPSRLDTSGQGDDRLQDEVNFARWTYEWRDHRFVVYEMSYLNRYEDDNELLYVLTPATTTATAESDGQKTTTDALLVAAGEWTSELHDEIWIYDNAQWSKSNWLWRSIKDASWDDVVLDARVKASLVRDVEGFFDSRALYKKLNVPWKRGIIFHGVPGNGKTVSIKALIKTLAARSVQPLYVKSLDACAGHKWSIAQIFEKARRQAPCLLVFEDLDSLVADKTRSYFLNEVDGLDSNDGILMIGSTNHLDRLDPAITKRPSRFDRKYFFKLPNEDERIAYCRYWRTKFAENDEAVVDFPDEICPLVAKLTEGFSFAYLKELFVTSLLMLARGGDDDYDDETGGASAGSSEIITPSESDAAVVVEAVDGASSSEPSKGEGVESKKDQKPKTEKRVVPEIDIPESLRGNLLLRIIKSQASLLLEDMDHEASDKARKGLPLSTLVAESDDSDRD